MAWILTSTRLNLTFEQSEATKSTLTLPADEVLDLTTLLLPGTVEEEELFPDFSVFGSFNFSTPSASLFLQCHFLKYTFIKFSCSGLLRKNGVGLGGVRSIIFSILWHHNMNSRPFLMWKYNVYVYRNVDALHITIVHL